MFSLFSYLWRRRKSDPEASERNEIEVERKIEEILDKLNSKSSGNGYDERVIHIPSQADNEIIKCSKLEGVITSLNANGGIINKKYDFLKVDAYNSWKKLKVLSRVSFLLYEGSTRQVSLVSDEWETNEVETIPVENPVGCSIDLRTVIGTVTTIEDGILKVEPDRLKPAYVELEKFPDLKWKFVEGDTVRLDCIVKAGAFFEDENESIIKVESIKPHREKHEVGRVTAVFTNFSVIDETVFVSVDICEEKLKPCSLVEFDAIESLCSHKGTNYEWRAIKVKKFEADQARKFENEEAIQMNDASFSIKLNHNKEVSHSVSVYNNAAERHTLHSCEITSNSKLVQLDRKEINFELVEKTGKFNIYLKIRPTQVGSFVEELVSDFGSFKKKCLITIQIYDEISSNNNTRPRGYYGNFELIPGVKVRQAPRFIEKKFSSYTIPIEFRQVDHKRKTELLQEDLSFAYPFIFEPLSNDNYVEKMRYCIYLEEIAMENSFAKYKIPRGHFENKGEYLRLEIEGVAENSPSIAIGDSVRAVDPYPSDKKKMVYSGDIHKVERNAILLKFNAEFHSKHNRKDYTIDFYFSRKKLTYQQHAVETIFSPQGLGQNFLFPRLSGTSKSPQVDATLGIDGSLVIDGNKFGWFSEKLNVYQKEAVINVLRGECKPLPYIIYGPPGTGKTATVTECIQQISDKISWSRIIVAAPSNSAANLIADRLLASGRYKVGDFVRIVAFNQIEKCLIPDHLKKFCATIDFGYDDGSGRNHRKNEDGLSFDCQKSIIVQYKIIISTLTSMGPLMHINFNRDHFTHVIIDEAGQSVEPETLIPISLVSREKGQVILAGDPKQLGPVVVSRIATISGFDESFLQRLSEHQYYLPVYGPERTEFDGRFVTKLKKNYRSLPSILGIYNNLYYGGELEAEVDQESSPEMQCLQSVKDLLTWNRGLANPVCGVYFVNVAHGRNMKTVESPSWCNHEEAAALYKFLCQLRSHGIDLNDVGIITPYRLQVKNLRRIITDSIPDCPTKIGTVEEFQGQERQIILVSTVRTDIQYLQTDAKFGLGFLKCPKRMNVAISRARSLLVVFGKESMLAVDDNWRHLIQYAKSKETFVNL